MDSAKKPSISPAPDGPYLVKGVEHFTNRHGAIETKPTMALCRCGASANKPFCDGTHAKNGFSSAKEEGRVEDKQEHYVGDQITIHDNRGLCAHAGRCTDGLPAVFRLGQEPWINPDGAGRDEIIATVGQCPSGALSTSADEVEARGPAGEPAIFVSPNGPYVVRGDLLDQEDGNRSGREKLTLCRCGGSKNKPFCDGSHWNLEFKDEKN